MTCSKLLTLLLALSLVLGSVLASNAQSKPAQAHGPIVQKADDRARGLQPEPPSEIAQIVYCADACRTSGKTFKIDSVRDLGIFVTWDRVTPGAHLQTLELLSPAGDPYQQLQTKFSAKGPLRGSHASVRTVLPIGGSWIQQRSAAGKWTVKLYLDNRLITTSSVELK